jgi:ABC-type nitrate/sulfonate/bicarbonate transport system permease component
MKKTDLVSKLGFTLGFALGFALGFTLGFHKLIKLSLRKKRGS